MKRLIGSRVASHPIRSLLAGALLAASMPAAPANLADNVIVFIGHGLGPATTTAARLFKAREEGSLTIDTMPFVARVRTASLDAQTTDGAAAVSAMMTGVQVRNEVVAMDGDTFSQGFAPGNDPIRNIPDGEYRCPVTSNGNPPASLFELAIEKQKATGIVTTARLTGGPSAATWAHTCHRRAEYQAARQAVPGGMGFNEKLGKGVDVMLGGASNTWRPYDATRRANGRPDGRELVGEMQAHGYTFVSDLTAMNAAPQVAGSRLLGLFDFGSPPGNMSYELDRDAAREPSLSQMTAKAIDLLTKNPKGYVLVVEGGRIGHALRSGSARRALVETLAFDEAVKTAISMVDMSRTLIIVVGDHDATLTLIGGGRRGSDVLGLHLNPTTGKPDLDAGGSTYTNLVFGTGPNRPDKRANLDTPTVVAKDYQQEAVIRLAGSTGGGGDVSLYAVGVGATRFRGSIANTQVFTLIRGAAGL